MYTPCSCNITMTLLWKLASHYSTFKILGSDLEIELSHTHNLKLLKFKVAVVTARKKKKQTSNKAGELGDVANTGSFSPGRSADEIS